MIVFVVRRAAQSVLLLLLISVAVFGLSRTTPGDPGVMLYGTQASAEDLAQFRERWGLDDPIQTQYAKWLANALSGDLGRSYTDGRPVSRTIAERIPASLMLTLSALVVALGLGTLMGSVAAARRDSRVDYAITLVATIFYASPAFWVGIILIFLFSVILGWLPSGGMRTAGSALTLPDVAGHLLLPATALSLREAGRVSRLMRASMLDVMARDFVRAAAAKGLTRAIVMRRHVLGNALLPLISLVGLAVPGLLSGAVVVETVFGWPGLGRLIVESALQRDYPVMMAEVLLVSVFALAGSLLADLAYAFVDPRIRFGKGEPVHG